MSDALQFPKEFGGSWGAFSKDWCFNQPMADSQDEISSALSTLQRLWPVRVERLVAEMNRGANFIASEIELGSLLRACENISGFRQVLSRLKAGEQPAYSELVIVAALEKLGFAPNFGKLVGKVKPDADVSLMSDMFSWRFIGPNVRSPQKIK
jgi:hypothetical protein